MCKSIGLLAASVFTVLTTGLLAAENADIQYFDQSRSYRLGLPAIGSTYRPPRCTTSLALLAFCTQTAPGQSRLDYQGIA